MALKGEAKRLYQREYMRRRRAQARTRKGLTETVTPLIYIGDVTGSNRPGKRLRNTWRVWWHRWLHRQPWYPTADQEEIEAARQAYRRELSGLVPPVSQYVYLRRIRLYIEGR